MKKRNVNDQNISNLKKREVLRILIILSSILTIIFAFANLFYNVNLIFGLLFFLIATVLNVIREKIELRKKMMTIRAK